MGASAHDKAIAALMKWAQREEWRERLDTIIADHFDPACEEFDIDPGELPDLLGPGAYGQLIGCAFEDFLTCDFDPDGANIVEDYLKRRGWKEPAPVKRYLEALRRSIMSLYEVVDTTPGSHFMARDLIRGGDPVRVKDKLASQSLALWDRLAARMLPMGKEVYMAGGVLPLSFDDSGVLINEFKQLKKDFTRSVKRRAKRVGVPADAVNQFPVDEAILSEMAPYFTGAWLTTFLRRTLEPSLPKMVNFDGEDLMFSETRFPVQDPAGHGEIERRLDGLADLARDEAEQPTWTWLSHETQTGAGLASAPGGVMLKTYDERGGRVLGSVRLDTDAVVLETNSAGRAERGRDWLAGVLDPLVGPAVTTQKTPEQMAAEQAAKGGAKALPEPSLSPEEMAAIIHEVEDQHYHELLNQPIPVLDGKSPKQAARSKAGRQKVADWLKYLENGSAHRASAQGHPPYDFGWMWEELKVTDLRH